MIKRKMGLALSTSDAILHHQGLVNLKSYRQNSNEAQITEFLIRINSENELTKQSTRMRIRKTQQNLRITQPILELNRDQGVDYVPLMVTFTNNFNFNTLIKAKIIGIGVKLTDTDTEE